jgi:uncharacterized protein (TIGR02145 family)
VRADGDGGGTAAGYVDLGLPSGTKWKAANEGGYYDYDSAMETFGGKLPTKEQFEELESLCTFTWDSERKGANFVSTVNGESIFLPASGYRGCDGDVSDEGAYGFYWSSTPGDSEGAWLLGIASSEVSMDGDDRCYGFAVRLVQD